MKWNRGEAPRSWIAARCAAVFVFAITVLSGAARWRSRRPTSSLSRRRPHSNQTRSSPDAGGPGGDTGVIALPKKKEEAPEPPPPPEPEVKNPPGMGNFSLRVDVPAVTVDVGVILEKTHQFVPGLKPGNFRVYEDGVAQKIRLQAQSRRPSRPCCSASLPPTTTPSSTTCATRPGPLPSSCGPRTTWR